MNQYSEFQKNYDEFYQKRVSGAPAQYIDEMERDIRGEGINKR